MMELLLTCSVLTIFGSGEVSPRCWVRSSDIQLRSSRELELLTEAKSGMLSISYWLGICVETNPDSSVGECVDIIYDVDNVLIRSELLTWFSRCKYFLTMTTTVHIIPVISLRDGRCSRCWTWSCHVWPSSEQLS